ncbi:GHKL domain-containing protein [Enterococcus sp. AZ196]|uniref:GHKL domain-containing protein n=1 Tax=Enterococcus sp. AZ196 TaxID=2774659 RepID=UPI003D2684B7
MIYFYSEAMSKETMFITLFFQMTPALIVYTGTLKYLFPTKVSWRTILLLTLPTYNLGWIFNSIVDYYFHDVLAVHNIFSIICQAFMMLLLYLVFYRGERMFLIDFLLVTGGTILLASIFEYLRFFLMNAVNSPFVSIYTINWYFLIFLFLLPLQKKLLNRIHFYLTEPSLSFLILLWTVLIAMIFFFMFVQVSSISGPDKYSNHTSVIFLAENYIGKSLVKWLAPSAFFIIEPIHHVFLLSSVLIFINMTALCAFSLLIFLNQRTKKKLDQQEQLKFELTNYINSLENVTQNIRKNHHDFSNLLFSLGGYIYQTPINEAELKKYFESITKTFEEDYHYFLEISKLKNLAIPELKTLVFTKLMTATKKNISFDIEIEQPIENIPIDHLSLSRICGILIDNALEAAEESEAPFVRLAIFEEKESYVLILLNSTKSEMLPASLLKKENFSTKGNNRGLGLSIVQAIIQSHSNQLSLETTQKDQEFCQTLIIKKERIHGH